MFGGEDETVIYPVACALEVFHNFTLLHDDLMDNAQTRRGLPSVHTKWNDNTAILSGDRMLIFAYELLLESCMSSEEYQYVSRLFNRMAAQICEGQQLDADLEKAERVSRADYEKMIKYKTGVLFATAFQMGAYLSRHTNSQMQQFVYDLGLKLGRVFQIQDDLLDVFGNEAMLGKPIGGDILCDKKAYPRIKAQKVADEATFQHLLTILHTASTDEQKIAEATALYSRLHLDQIGQSEVDELFQEMMADLAKLPDNTYRNDLQLMIKALIKRVK